MKYLTPIYLICGLLNIIKYAGCGDGEHQVYPPQYLSGSIHYFRVRPEDWKDRIQKLKYMGFNAVQTYVEWSTHEPEPEQYKFSGDADLEAFMAAAHSEGMFVILRPGPFICAERDMGGLPYWLLRLHPKVKLRSSDSKFLSYVQRWFDVLLPRLRPFLAENGGPIIGIQVENEYGNCDVCDFSYLQSLKDILRGHLGNNTFLFSTDNGATASLKCGKLSGVYATVDFGPDADLDAEFNAQRLFQPVGPLINSEFYQGWFDHWGQPHARTDTEKICSSLRRQLSKGASVNLYVFHGGTNFGLSAGSNIMKGKFMTSPTSYDYDAPLNEAGDPTEKFFAIRKVVSEFFPVPKGPPPKPSPKFSYGQVNLHSWASIFDIIPHLRAFTAKFPSTFEELGISGGIVVYETFIPERVPSPAILELFNLHDRGYVFIDENFQGIISRQENMYEIPILCRKDDKLSIVVESQGRLSVGTDLNEFKGITNPPMLNTRILTNLNMTTMGLTNISNLKKVAEGNLDKRKVEVNRNKGCSPFRSRFFIGELNIPKETNHPMNTFLKLDGWTKGYVWINNFLLGRYWPVVGPQLTLYVPHGILRKGLNTVTILELECYHRSNKGKSSEFTVEFVDYPEIDGPIPVNH